MPIAELDELDPRDFDGQDQSIGHSAGPVFPAASGGSPRSMASRLATVITKVNEVANAVDALPLSATALAAITEKTIASGAITITTNYHTVDTESDAASDDLDSIAGGEIGQLVVLRPANDARTVVVKHSATIICPGGRDISLAEDDDYVLLVRHSVTAWVVLASKLTPSGIALMDNAATAYQFAEAANAYLTFVTTNSGEKIVAAKRLTVTDGVSSGTERIVGGMANAGSAASTAITGTTETEANFDTTYTLPANSLKVGTVVRIRAQGIATAQTGSETFILLVKCGSVSLAVTGNIDIASNNDVFDIEFEFICRATGGSGTVVGSGICRHGARAGTATSILLATGSGSTSTATVDTTAANILAIAIDRQATATDSDSVRLDSFKVEVIG